MIATQSPLTLDDLEALAFRYGGTLEPLDTGGYRLVGAVIAGTRINFGPVFS